MSAILLVTAHPDDETMGTGGMIVRHSRADIQVHLICVTRGEAGWLDRPPGKPEGLARTRTAELERAAALLGVSSVKLWDYPDGAGAGWNHRELTDQIALEIRRLDPEVIVGWGPDGAYGHPDHVAAGACTDEALFTFGERERPTLYHMVLNRENEAGYREAIAAIGQDASAVPIVGYDTVSVILELSPLELETKVAAIDCHESQIQEWRIALRTPGRLQRSIYGRECYVRTPNLGGEEVLSAAVFPELQPKMARTSF